MAVAAGLAAGVVVGGTAVAFAVARTGGPPMPRRTPAVEGRGTGSRAAAGTPGRTPDTVRPGRYGVFVNGTLDYLKLGAVLSRTEQQVTRKLLTHVAEGER